MRRRLRAAYTAAELADLYPVPHQHANWPDHVERVRETIDVSKVLPSARRIADLSCGDAVIAKAIAVRYVKETGGTPDLILGDLAPGYEIHGPIEHTILGVDHVGIFVCCETLEHIDDPDGLLAAIRYRSETLLLSTPLGEATDANPEHYWAWDDAGVGDMLIGAGWAPLDYREVRHPLAAYQIWACT